MACILITNITELNSDVGNWVDISSEIIKVSSRVTLRYALYNKKLKQLAINYSAWDSVANQSTLLKIPTKYGKYFATTDEFIVGSIYDATMKGDIMHKARRDDYYNYIISSHTVNTSSTASVHFYRSAC